MKTTLKNLKKFCNDLELWGKKAVQNVFDRLFGRCYIPSLPSIDLRFSVASGINQFLPITLEIGLKQVSKDFITIHYYHHS